MKEKVQLTWHPSLQNIQPGDTFPMDGLGKPLQLDDPCVGSFPIPRLGAFANTILMGLYHTISWPRPGYGFFGNFRNEFSRRDQPIRSSFLSAQQERQCINRGRVSNEGGGTRLSPQTPLEEPV